MKLFRLVFDYRVGETCKQLRKYKLKGVRGVSASGRIIYRFLGVARDAVLMMPAKDVLRMNNLVELDYSNPDFLLANDMEMARRVFSKENLPTPLVLHNLYDYFFRAAVSLGYIDKTSVDFTAPGQSMSYTDAARNAKINSVKDFIKLTRTALKQVYESKGRSYYGYFKDMLDSLTDSDYRKIIKKMAELIGSVFGDEKEWVLVGTDTLRIPKNSMLIIRIPDSYKDVMKEVGKITSEKDLIELARSHKKADLFRMDSDKIKFYADIARCGLGRYYKSVRFLTHSEYDRIQHRFFDYADKYSKEHGKVL